MKSIVYPTLELAREKETEIKIKILRGDKIEKPTPVTLSVFWEKYFKPDNEKKAAWKSDESRYKLHIKEGLGDKRLDRITDEDIKTITQQMEMKGYAVATRNQIPTLMSRVFTQAKKKLFIEGNNPCSLVSKADPNNQVENYLTKDEIKALIQTLKSWTDRVAANLILMALFTGLRRSSLFRMKWQDVNFELGIVKVYLKGGRYKNIALSELALNVLRETPNLCEYVFAGKPEVTTDTNGNKVKTYGQRIEIKRSWDSIKKAAKINRPFRFHDIRHTYATILAMSGVNLFEIQTALGHTSSKTTQRYAHLLPEGMRRVANIGAQAIEQGTVIDLNTRRKIA